MSLVEKKYLNQLVAVVIVTHNSELEIEQCLEKIWEYERERVLIIIVDSGSDNPEYLRKHGGRPRTIVDLQKNIGFSQANNRGFALCPISIPFVLFLNPDVLLNSSVTEQCIQYMDENPTVGCLTGKMLGYDMKSQKTTGLLDSTGVFRKWYGRWFDRGQGKTDKGLYELNEDLPAACGAFMFCRREALEEVSLGVNVIFDPDFFLYKEDIELSLRFRKKGWRIAYLAGLVVGHGRGWKTNRKQMPYFLRELAARNELLLYRKHPSPYIVWAFIKYLLVRGLKV